jgi:hypothetical protein
VREGRGEWRTGSAYPEYALDAMIWHIGETRLTKTGGGECNLQTWCPQVGLYRRDYFQPLDPGEVAWVERGYFALAFQSGRRHDEIVRPNHFAG